MTHTIAAIVISAFVIPLAGFAQPVRGAADRDAEARIIERISAIQSDSGPDAVALIEPMTELADYYHDTGDYALAVPVIDRALGLIRNNFGLTALDQAPLLRLQLASERAVGDTTSAWETEQELLRLARDNPDDLRAVAILRDIADSRIDMLERYVGGDFVPEVLLGCYYKAPRHHMASCYAGSKSDAASSILTDAGDMYRDAADVIIGLDIYPSTDLVQIETTLARIFYLHGPPRRAESAYEVGRGALLRLHDYEVAHSDSLLDHIGALVRIADWDLVYVRQPKAMEIYQSALDRLNAGGATRQEIASLFAPEIPVAIPDFVQNPLVSDTVSRSGHVDIALEITRYGRSRKVEIIETVGEISEQSLDELVQAVKLRRFRPRINADGIIDDTSVSLRYFFGDQN